MAQEHVAEGRPRAPARSASSAMTHLQEGKVMADLAPAHEGQPPGFTGPIACKIFPLPVPEAEGSRYCRSRRSQQRWGRHKSYELREMVLALSWMHTGDFNARAERPEHPLQTRVLDRLRRLVLDGGELGSLDRPPGDEAALKELLKGRSEYSSDCPTTLAPHKLDLISLPTSLADSPEAVSLLTGDDRLFLEEQERMILPNNQPDPSFRPYWGPALRSSARSYRKFVQRLHDIQCLKYTLFPMEFAGVFFVWKSGRQKTRVIIDARAAHRRFIEMHLVSKTLALRLTPWMR